MRVVYRFGPAALAFAATLGLACTDSNAPRAIAKTLAKFAGDTQSALTGTPLPDALTVRVLGSTGSPFAGAVVTWAVTSGNATLGASSDTTDSQGRASTTVALGSVSGSVAVEAAVTSLTPVTFTATACDHPVIALGDTVPGGLSAADCRFGGYFTDFYEVAAPTGPQGLTLTMTAGFATYLELYQRSGGFVSFDDESDTATTNSRIRAIVPADDYLIAPSSLLRNVVGAYSVSAVARPAELAGCALVWTMRGVVIGDSVTTTDCVDSTGGIRYYADKVALWLEAGTVLKVSHQSAAFDAALFLRTRADQLVAANNDSASTTTNAYLVYSVVQSGEYRLFAATNAAGATGPYTLTISRSTTLSGSPPSARGPTVPHMEPARMPKGAWLRAPSP
jgi:hypothetical protein